MTACPFSRMTTSPGSSPAAAAGLPASARSTTSRRWSTDTLALAPSSLTRRTGVSRSSGSSTSSWPMSPCQMPLRRRTLIMSAATRSMLSTGIANPIPWAPARMATFTPISSPLTLSSGPPELPGLMLASVWINALYDISLLSTTSRLVALTTPTVTVCS